MEHKDIPYIVFEGTLARFERTIKRLIVALIIVTTMLFFSNAMWLYEWSQYDYTSEEVQVDAQDGVANYIGRDGDINGTNYSP